MQLPYGDRTVLLVRRAGWSGLLLPWCLFQRCRCPTQMKEETKEKEKGKEKEETKEKQKGKGRKEKEETKEKEKGKGRKEGR
jgi:hypothetical protein